MLRAAAIVLIVGTHAKVWHLPGGAHLLLAVAGYNFARFHLRAGSVLASVARIAVPSMCWIGAVAAVSDVYRWPNVLLVNGYFGAPSDRWGYWFIEVLVMTLLGLGLLLAVPAIARLERRRPFALPVAAVAAGFLVRFDLIDIATTRRTSRPQEVFWIFALGWAASRSGSWPQRLLVTALAAVGLHGFFGDGHRELLVLAGVAATVWLPVVALPRLVQRLVAPLAGASLHIYLIHFQLYPPVARTFGRPAAVVAALLVGAFAWYASRGLMVRAELLYRSLRSRVVASAESRVWPASSTERSLLGWR